MIIEAPYKMGDTVSVKLGTGEEVIARMVSEDKDHLTVSKPMILVATEQGVGFAPFMFTISPETQVKIRLNNIICVVKAAKDAADLYIKQTTGLAV